MLSPKLKGLLEGFLTGATAATVIYTLLLQAGYVVSASGAEAIADSKIKPLQDNIDTILLLALESRIRDLTHQLCDATPALRSALQPEIDRLQNDHLKLAKVYYNVAVQCAEP